MAMVFLRPYCENVANKPESQTQQIKHYGTQLLEIRGNHRDFGRGRGIETPNRSIITNPLAYRVLLVDMDVWRFGESQVIGGS
jgi:hypothetical protein